MADPATPLNDAACERIRVRGLVQGVGFRPTVYRLAREMALDGEVLNDGEGVLILLRAGTAEIDRFVEALWRRCPPLGRIDALERAPYPGALDAPGFRIRPSERNAVHTGIVPDAAPCTACLGDIGRVGDRRRDYAFTNCTHCGPRLSIASDIPWDRAHTSMAEFALCPACRAEYEDPGNRRFHAQPNACPTCGPALTLADGEGAEIPCADVIGEAARLIGAGRIVAIKGIGGFQLACAAGDAAAVARLRARKRRPHKAFALMAANLAQVKRYCRVAPAESAALEAVAAPIVLLERAADGDRLAAAVAPGQATYGFMLPSSPLHHLLMRALDGPIVLTSGNAAEEPQCIDNRQALERLSGIADHFVLHDRDIVNRVDDSVLRVVDGRPSLYRRARGYAPAPLAMPPGFAAERALLACGGELKNTFCLLQDGQAFLSQHIGNLTNTLAYADFRRNLDLYHRLYRFDARAVAIDRHPDYLSSRHGAQLAAERGLPLIDVQHHHAHIAACLADNGWGLDRGRVIGVALDGIGFGDDGGIWGGEFGLADYAAFERLARFRPVPMPGGNKATLEPWRNTYAQLKALPDWARVADEYADLRLFRTLRRKPLALIERMLEARLNSPLTSSCGRLFDAVAAALGVCADAISYEGQAAIELEARIDPHDLATQTAYPFELEPGALLEIDPAPMWRALLEDLRHRQKVSAIAARFHLGLAAAIGAVAERLRRASGISTVALSGGVFQNASLLRLARETLERRDFEVLTHRQVPCNDGGLALGQAAVACARLQRAARLD